MAVETGDKKLGAPPDEASASASDEVDGAGRRRRRPRMRVPSDDVPRPKTPPSLAASADASPTGEPAAGAQTEPADGPPVPSRASADDDFDFDVDIEETASASPTPDAFVTKDSLEVDVVPEAEESAPAVEAETTTPTPAPVAAEEEIPTEELSSDVLEEISSTPARGVPAITAEEEAAAAAPPLREDLVVDEPSDDLVGVMDGVMDDSEPVAALALATPPEIGAASMEVALVAVDTHPPTETAEELDGSALEEVVADEEPPRAPTAAASPPPAPARARTPEKRPPPAPPPAAVAAAAAALDRPKKRRTKAWFEEVFDEDYLRTLPFLTPKTTQREAAHLIEALGLKQGQSVLDVGCGYGRHAMEMAARGHNVVALDLSLPLLLRGADEAQRRGLSINFVHGDMREMAYEAQFDGVYCVFSTFGYFDDDANKRTAQLFARALRPGGRLVLELLNRDYIITDLPTRVWWEGDGCVVLEEVDFNYFTSRLVSNRSIVFDDGRQVEQEISIRSYSLHEVGKLLHGAGFRVLSVSGGLAARGRFFGKDSRQIIVVAERRGDSGTRDSVPTPDGESAGGRVNGKTDDGSQHVTSVKVSTPPSP